MSEYRQIQVTKMTPLIGAEVRGVRLADKLSEDVVAEIRRAWLENLVLFFRDQPMSTEQHQAFGKRFGPVFHHPASPIVDGVEGTLSVRADSTSHFVAGAHWHTDTSCQAKPPSASILHVKELPPCGGDTVFANMYAVYNALSDPMKELLHGKTALHSGAGYKQWSDKHSAQSTVHPVIRTHPETHQQCLFVNSTFTTKITELNENESKAILQLLFSYIAWPQFQCRFRWQKDSVAMWDNRCVQHQAMWDYYPQTRDGVRVTLEGDAPVFDASARSLGIAPDSLDQTAVKFTAHDLVG